MGRRNSIKKAVRRSAKCVREGYEREQLFISNKEGKEYDFLDRFITGIVVVMIVGALLSLGLK